MNRSRSFEASLGSSEHLEYPAITAIQQHIADSQPSIFADFFDDALGPAQNLDPLQQYLGYGESYHTAAHTAANTAKQSAFASSTDAQRNSSHAQSTKHIEGAPRGTVKYGEAPGSICAGREAQQNLPRTASSPYNTQRRAYTSTSQSTFTPMAAPADLTEARPTPYSPYRGLFLDSNAARDHRHMSTRFGRQPYIPAELDASIGEVERNRDQHIGRLYEAMISGSRAQDNTGSIAMKRWVNGAHYKSDLIEAFAHKVFDCLLVQVKEGFRGWHHNDYVDDERKGEKEDREADCATRLENVIDALEREKTICEDVVNSASQIRMFVNAPIAYAQRKFQNRQGNSKRGRAKEGETKSRSARMRRVGGRCMRTRSSATPDRPVRDTTPHFHMPYYTGVAHQHPARRDVPSPHTYRHAPVPAQSNAAMSPPPLLASRTYTPHVAVLPQYQHAAPASPLTGLHGLPADWPSVDTFSAVDPALGSEGTDEKCDTSLWRGEAGGFEELWNGIEGVQRFCFGGSEGE